MSKERELLKEALKVLEWNGIMGSHDTYNSIKELLAQPEQDPDIDYFVKEIHKKCFLQSLDTAPVITVRDALSIFRKFLKSKRTPVVKPKLVRKGTKAWSDELNELDKAVKQSENLGKMYDEL